MNATSAARVPSAGKPDSRKHSKSIQFLMKGSATVPSKTLEKGWMSRAASRPEEASAGRYLAVGQARHGVQCETGASGCRPAGQKLLLHAHLLTAALYMTLASGHARRTAAQPSK